LTQRTLWSPSMLNSCTAFQGGDLPPEDPPFTECFNRKYPKMAQKKTSVSVIQPAQIQRRLSHSRRQPSFRGRPMPTRAAHISRWLGAGGTPSQADIGPFLGINFKTQPFQPSATSHIAIRSSQHQYHLTWLKSLVQYSGPKMRARP
jgi:hypothetical protein